MENLPQEQRKQRLIQSKPSEKGEITDYLSRMGDVLHDIAEWGKFVVPLVTVHTVRNSNQAHIVLREKFLRQPTDLYVVTAQPGQVFDKNRGDIPGFDGGYHFLKARALHSSACNTIIHEK